MLDAAINNFDSGRWVPLKRSRLVSGPSYTLTNFGSATITHGHITPLDDVVFPSDAEQAAVRNGELGDRIVTDKPASRLSTDDMPQG